MKVLDATFLIDYLDGVAATREFYEANGGEDQRWIMPVPAYAEVLVGEGNLPGGDVTGAREALSWGEPYRIDERTAVVASALADDIGPGGPFLDGLDALIGAVGRELDAPVVAADSDLTHPKTKQVLAVEEY